MAWGGWTEELAETLRQMVADGLCLPKKPSPIKKESFSGRSRTGDAARAAAGAAALRPTLPPVGVAVPPQKVTASAVGKSCGWPMWGNEPPTHVYCGKPVALTPGGYHWYCPDHFSRSRQVDQKAEK